MANNTNSLNQAAAAAAAVATAAEEEAQEQEGDQEEEQEGDNRQTLELSQLQSSSLSNNNNNNNSKQEIIPLKSRIATQIELEFSESDNNGHNSLPSTDTIILMYEQKSICLKQIGLPLCQDCNVIRSKYHKGEISFFDYMALSSSSSSSSHPPPPPPSSVSVSSEKLCRFENFRRIYKQNNRSLIEGFPCPYRDATPAEKIELYPTTVDFKKMKPLSVERLTYVLSHIHKSFCKLVQDEDSAMKLNLNENKLLAWKKHIDLVREMCDVCQTTIFNNHWICRNCGLSICIDCYRERRDRDLAYPKEMKDLTITNGVDRLGWIACTNGRAHIQNQLMLTKILCGDPLLKLSEFSHNLCRAFKIPMNCGCTNSDSPNNNDEQSFNHLTEADKDFHAYGRKLYEKTFLNPIQRAKSIHEKTIDVVESSASASASSTTPSNINNNERKPKPKLNQSNFNGIDMIWKDTHINYNWICDGDMLQLNEPLTPSNTKLFQEQWSVGRPTLITQVYKHKEHVWSPAVFSKLVGNQIADIQNCSKDNEIISDRPLKFFWDGFETQNNCGLFDDPSVPDVLKLRDWPTKADFAEVLPLQFRNFMNKLPFPQYTTRHGFLNLASYLPDNYLKPDLGPKMYSAYASQINPIVGVTNLHIDVSDAINVAVFSSIADCEKDQNELYYVIFLLKYKILSLATNDAAGDGNGNPDDVDHEMIEQLKLKVNEMPCAIWHIWSSKDVDLIREFLNEIKCERGGDGDGDGILQPKSNEDPIHDQTFYLDVGLRKRLEKEKGVKAYTVFQNLGDAILIPAGAPHQVFNLQSCVKVAEDFVSPENVELCMELTQQFRLLSDSHKNHEDILQMKHILFHSMRSIVSQLIKHIDTLEMADIRKMQKKEAAAAAAAIIQQQQQEQEQQEQEQQNSSNENVQEQKKSGRQSSKNGQPHHQKRKRRRRI